MARVSIEAALNTARDFAAREWRLLLPVILAFQALPALLVDVARPANFSLGNLALAADQLSGGFMLLLFAAMLVTLYGALALAALIVVPRQSVAEALALAARRLPIWLGASLLLGMAMLLGLILLTLFLGVGGAAVRGARVDMLIAVLAIAGLVLITARLLPLVPLVVDRPLRPVAAVKAAWTMTAGHFWRLLGFLVLFALAAQLVSMALVSATGSVLLLLGRAAGWAALADAAIGLIAALVGAFVNAAFVLIVSAIYRQLSGANTGI